MLKKFGEEKLNFQLRQHFAGAVAACLDNWGVTEGADAELLLEKFFDELAGRAIEESEIFHARLLPHRWRAEGIKGAALLLSLYEPELRFQKALLFRARVSINRASTEEGNLFDTRLLREEAEELLRISQASCFTSFAPQGIHVISASSILGDNAGDAYLLKNFYYLNIADFVGNLFFKCFVGDSRPGFIARLKEGKCCRSLLEIRITAVPPASQKPLF